MVDISTVYARQFQFHKIFHNFVDNCNNLYYTIKGIEAWLSLVERCVRDAEAVGSNPVASILR